MFKWKFLVFIGLSYLATLSFADNRQLLSIGAEHYPPYEMKEPIQGLRGFDYEVAITALTLVGYQAEVDFLPWKRVVQYAKMGKVVGMLSCSYRREREEFVIYSNPISEAVRGYYVRKGFDGPKPFVLEDVKEQRVGSVTAYGSIKELQSNGFKPVAARNTELAVSMLVRKRFDYLYLGRQATDFVIKELGLADQLDFYPISRKDYYLCFSKRYQGIKPIVEAFNAALLVMKKNGTYQAIHDKYK
ncbi:MAG: transporter substrate-binding domain-containing protein [Pseudomonadales bacterium]|nr:transporter substrate-binding domain-containing protein [Pseudomonadales bacterium]NRA14482.1 transporter substrate-binding domain-containing protein [Oceanospirillaceae bacterium]